MAVLKNPDSLSFRRLAFCLPFAFLLSSSAVLAQTSYGDYNTDWTGIYVGVGGGMGGWITDSDVTLNGARLTARERMGGYGGFGTVYAGYDYLFCNYAVVAGLFADGNWGDMQGDMGFPGVVGRLSETGSWEAGARLGRLISHGTLPYVTGGYSQAYFSKSNLNIATAAEPASGAHTPSFTSNGWFVGGGLESEINEYWSLRGEYRFARYNQQSIHLNGIPALTTARLAIKPIVQTFVAAVIYKI